MQLANNSEHWIEFKNIFFIFLELYKFFLKKLCFFTFGAYFCIAQNFLNRFPKFISCLKVERLIFKMVYLCTSMYLLFDLICQEIWWGKIKKFIFFFSYFFKFVHSWQQTLIKKYRMSDNIFKVCFLVKNVM